MMNRAERHAQILALLAKRTGASAGELARHFNVSRMTIHRDLEELDGSGQLQRIRGGATLRSTEESGAGSLCTACGRRLLSHQSCELEAARKRQGLYCCAACGLRQLRKDPGASLLVKDMVTGLRLPAEDAFFLVNSLAAPCCQPSLLSFAREDEVGLFQAGFGGAPTRLAEALEFLRVAADLGEE